MSVLMSNTSFLFLQQLAWLIVMDGHFCLVLSIRNVPDIDK
jgi:hypothetical protein